MSPGMSDSLNGQLSCSCCSWI